MLIAAVLIIVDILSLSGGTLVLSGPVQLGDQSRSIGSHQQLADVPLPGSIDKIDNTLDRSSEAEHSDKGVGKYEIFESPGREQPPSLVTAGGFEKENTGPQGKGEAKGEAKGEESKQSAPPNPSSSMSRSRRARAGSGPSSTSPLQDRTRRSETDVKTKIERLYTRLRHTKLVLGKQRTLTNSRLTCGGSHTIQWRSYRDIRDSFIDKTKLYRHLPPNSVSLIDLSKAVSNSTCFKRHRYNYKQNNCTFVAPSDEQGPNDQADLCAVVGNGGRLRQEYHEEEINAADIVIRFNQGVTSGFEKHVGSKSTIRMYNGPYISPKQPGEITIAQIREMAIRAWVKAAQKHENEHLGFMFDPDFICHAWDWVDRRGEKPSSGLVGIIMSLRLCKHTNVYGFQFDEYFNSSIRPHYYNWERPKPGRENVHPFAEEKKLYKTLQEMGKLTLF